MLGTMAAGVASQVLDRLWETAEELVSGGVTRSHDLTGIVFQRLIADRKFLATFYTRPASAALLAGLALPADKAPGGADWGDADTLAAMQIGDFACGTGTLLSAAYQRVSLLHELHGGDPEKLHAPMMRHGLVGLDVLTSAVHLTATMLAGSHPRIPFDGECLLTMPYGEQDDEVALGSLNLLSSEPQIRLLGAAAKTAGGREPEEVRDLVVRVEHDRFSLVIMNPPFTRYNSQEGETVGTYNPAFAAFGTDEHLQRAMRTTLSALRGTDYLATGNAGVAADFIDLAMRKLGFGGTLALVLPLSVLVGSAWEPVRQRLRNDFAQIIAVTIAASGSDALSFSADTGMAECLVIAKRHHSGAKPKTERGIFIVLRSKPTSTVLSNTIATNVSRMIRDDEISSLESLAGTTALHFGDDRSLGSVINGPLPDSGPWQLVGIADLDLAAMAWELTEGILRDPRRRSDSGYPIPLSVIGQIANRGPHARSIRYEPQVSTEQGPLEIISPLVTTHPMYPVLWAHHARFERRFMVAADAEGRVARGGDVEARQARAVRIWKTATRLHYNRDLRFNSQSLVVSMTDTPCIGGRAWPSLIFANEDHEYAFALWANSSLGILMHWWMSNKTQSGRGTTSVTAIPEFPALDVRMLSAEQHQTAKRAFEELSSLRFLPFDQIDEDPARAELDRRLLVEVLGLPEELCEPGGAMELLRRKLAAEPQIHGGKKTRIIFEDLDEPDPKTGLMWRERMERRDDR